MKKLYLFLVALIVSCVAVHASKVYFDPTGCTWGKIYAYVWNGSVTGQKDWPGNQMTKNSATGLYEIEFNGTPEKIIFNNGSDSGKTADLPFVDGATYKSDGTFTGGGDVETFTIKATFDNTSTKWSKVYIYYWNGGGSCSWPGKEMTKSTGNLYTYTEEGVYSLPANVIFNNGGDSGKTGNLDFVNDATWNINGQVEGPGPGPDPQPTVPEHLYLLSNDVDTWNLSTPAEFTKDESVFTLSDVVLNPNADGNVYINLATTTGADWDAINGADRYGAATEGAVLTVGTAVDVTKYAVNVDAMGCKSWEYSTEKAVKASFSMDFATMKLTLVSATPIEGPGPGPDPDPDPTVPEHLYLLSNDVDTWNLSTPAEFTKAEKVFTVSDVTLTPTKSGKVYINLATTTGADWDAINGADRYGAATEGAVLTVGTAVDVTKYAVNVDAMGCKSWEYSTEKAVKASFSMDFATMKLTLVSATPIEGPGPGPDPDPDPNVPEHLYLLANDGDAAAWNLSTPAEFTKAEKVFTVSDVTLTPTKTGKVYINLATTTGADWDAINGADRYGAATEGVALTAGTAVDVTKYAVNVDAMGCKSWEYSTDKAVKASFSMDFSTMKLTLVSATPIEGPGPGPDPDPDPTVPEHLYLIGDVNGASWSTSEAPELTKSGNVFSISDVALTPNVDGNVYFSFITATGADWDTVNSSDRYGAPANDTPCEYNTPMTFTKYTASVNASSAASWVMNNVEGKASFSVDFDNMTVTVTYTSGVAVFSADGKSIRLNGGRLTVDGADEVAVFSTNGMLISTSAESDLVPGLYIVVIDGKSQKIMVK